jgi:predicted nucleotidyltransferase
MNLSEPLDGLTTAVEAAVLRVLARSDAGFSGRQVHGLAGVGSTSSVHRALGSLVRVGLVTSEARPPAIIYRANREHVLWSAVESGLAARTRAFDSIRRFCEQDLPADLGLTVVVYGSVARRESTLDSDVDLFVVYPDGTDEDVRADANYRLADHVRRATGSEAQVLSVERGDFAQRVAENDPLVENVVADGIHLFGPPLETVASSAA